MISAAMFCAATFAIVSLICPVFGTPAGTFVGSGGATALAEAEVEGTAGGGVVRAVVTGKQTLVSITIDPAAVDPEDVEMLELIGRIQNHAPPGSILIVEADENFDFDLLRGKGEAACDWDVRAYPPAIIGVWRA